MPTITVRSKEWKETGPVRVDRFEYKVGAGGIFYAQVPPEYEDIAAAHGGEPRRGGGYNVKADRLVDLEKKLAAIQAAYLDVRVTEELVILYHLSTIYDAAVLPDGSMAPNLERQSGGKWVGSSTPGNTWGGPSYGLNIGARVYMKKTTISTGYTRVSYGHCFLPTGTAGAELNRFVHLAMLKGETQLGDGVKEMPYSDAAAEFFTKSLLAMVSMCHRFHTALASVTPAELEAAIHSNAVPLLSSSEVRP